MLIQLFYLFMVYVYALFFKINWFFSPKALLVFPVITMQRFDFKNSIIAQSKKLSSLILWWLCFKIKLL